jgi:RNA polymerase sigma-70 factor (ECF subfamily)
MPRLHCGAQPSDGVRRADRPRSGRELCRDAGLFHAARVERIVRVAEAIEATRLDEALRDIEDLDTDEAAEILGVTPNAAKIRLHRARQALRTLIAEELAGDRTATAAESAAAVGF